MLVSGNARILVSENAILPSVAPYLNSLRAEKPEVFRHSLNVAYLVAEIILRNYTEDLSLSVEKDSLNDVIQGALLHDIGKLRLDNRILLKESPLNEEEIEEIRKHPLYGYQMLERDTSLSIVTKNIVLSHHERPDGSGYPYHIKDISNSVKIVSICDKYDALTENRSYRPKKDLYTAFKIILEEQDESDFDMLLLLASINDK